MFILTTRRRHPVNDASNKMSLSS